MNDYSREQFLTKSLPANTDAEKLVLGAVLIEPNLAHLVFSILEPSDFYNPSHRSIARAMQYLARNGKPIDPITISEEIKKTGSIESLGGVAAITNLSSGIPHISGNRLKPSCLVIKEKSVSRQAIATCNKAISDLLAEEEEPEAVLSRLRTELLKHRPDFTEAASMKAVTQNVREMFDNWATGEISRSSLKTGIPELDQHLKLKGLARGELTLICARPSIGKTALLIQIATSVARLDIPVVFVSLEMAKERIVMRMLPSVTGVENKAINPYTVKNLPEQHERLNEGLAKLEELKIFFDKTKDIDKLLTKLDYYVLSQDVGLIAFDYLQLLQNTNIKFRENELGNITTALKDIGVRSNAAILGAAQLNRESEKDHRRPKLSDIRETGVAEQAADVVLFPYDEEAKAHDKNPADIENVMYLDLYCAKQRDGARYWSVPLRYDKNLQIFESDEMRGDVVKVAGVAEDDIPF